MATIAPLLLFEQPLARVPHEQFRKGFRTTQRNFERDFGTLASSCVDLGKLAEDHEEEASVQTAEASLDAMIARVEALQRKISDVQKITTVPMQRAMRARTDHLAAFESIESTTDYAFHQWTDTRMDRWLVDYMLRSNRFESAQKLSTEKGIDALVDIPVFAEIQRVTAALRRQSCTEALAWCGENKASLRKAKSTLEFELRMQEFIELARGGKYIPAIGYSKKHLSPWYDTHPVQFRQAMALLAYDSRLPKNAAYRRLYDASRWETLAGMFTDTAYSLTSLPSSPLLSLALYAGLSALKHPICTSSVYDDDGTPRSSAGKSHDCPVCDSSGLGTLALKVPGSQHLISSLVCAISGKLMDDNNPPMAFRNGYVYSRRALEEMAAHNGGVVTCPRSGETINFSELRKVFVT